MRRIIGPLLALLTLTGAYLYGFPAPTLVVRSHRHRPRRRRPRRGGVARAAGACGRHESWPARVGWAAVALGAAAGLAIVKTGGTLPYRPLVLVHIASSVAGIVILSAERLARMGRPISPADRPLGPGVIRERQASGPGFSAGRLLAALAAVAVVTAAVGYGAWYVREVRWHQSYRIQNPTLPPAAMTQEGLGEKGPFFPSSIRTPDGKKIKSSFFMTRRRAGAATATSTSSGTARRTTSRRSTTSGTASRSSTCRTWSARSRRSGAPAATITRCSSTAASTGRSRSRSTRRKRRPGSAARRATRSRTSTARWARATSTIEYPPLHDLAASEQPGAAVRCTTS